MISDDVLIRCENVSKKFCSDLKKSLWYGVQDIAGDVLGEHSSTTHFELRPGEFWANHDINIEVRRGECLGLIGRNGAGKTTLLKMLNGLVKPDTGRIEIRGNVAAMIALGAGFNPVLTGRENIQVNGSILGLSKRQIKNQFDEIVEFAELDAFIDTPVRNYSSGMNVRLGFAIAVCLIKPDVLLLDEVMAVGDIAFRLKAFNAVTELLKNAAVILVSHHPQQVSRYCNKCLLLDRGAVRLFTNDVSSCLDQYAFADSKGPVSTTIGEGSVEQLQVFINDQLCENTIAKANNADRCSVMFRLVGLRTIQRMSVAVTIEDATGDAAAIYRSARHYERKRSTPVSVSVELGPLELAPGRYFISIVIIDMETWERVLYAIRLTEIRVHGPVHEWSSALAFREMSIVESNE